MGSAKETKRIILSEETDTISEKSINDEIGRAFAFCNTEPNAQNEKKVVCKSFEDAKSDKKFLSRLSSHIRNSIKNSDDKNGLMVIAPYTPNES